MAFPRIFQRLFANEGVGPKLRHDIIPWDEESRIASIAPLEAWRQAMIGTSMPMASTTLPAGFMWADGSFASFATYPELKAKYDAGGLTGMLLAYDAQEADISAYPGKFKPDSANPTGLFVPRLNGLFARYWTPGAEEEAGAWHRDEIRNITGELGSCYCRTAADTNYVAPTGAFNMTISLYKASLVSASSRGVYGIDASLVVPTGEQNVPQHVWQPTALYLGSPAQI